jgi:hypothetical protein
LMPASMRGSRENCSKFKKILLDVCGFGQKEKTARTSQVWAV